MVGTESCQRQRAVGKVNWEARGVPCAVRGPFRFYYCITLQLSASGLSWRGRWKSERCSQAQVALDGRSGKETQTTKTMSDYQLVEKMRRTLGRSLGLGAESKAEKSKGEREKGRGKEKKGEREENRKSKRECVNRNRQGIVC
jgi:hypothetical protein